MKTVVLIGNTSAQLTYFANTIHKHHKVDLVIVEKKNSDLSTNPKSNEKKRKKHKISFLEKLLRYVLFRIELKRKRKQQKDQQKKNADYYKSLFQRDYEELNSEIFVLEVEDINSKKVENAIRKINPNLIIDHGTSLVKPHIIDLAELSLNLHWGLSPYYRGVNCTNQALLNWDINNIGVTIHKLARKIDGGDILGQERVKVEPTDTIDRITSRLTFEGVGVVIKAIDKLKKGETLNFKSQDFNNGFLIRGINWDYNVQQHVNQIREDLLLEMINKPSRKPAPIIKLE